MKKLLSAVCCEKAESRLVKVAVKKLKLLISYDLSVMPLTVQWTVYIQIDRNTMFFVMTDIIFTIKIFYSHR